MEVQRLLKWITSVVVLPPGTRGPGVKFSIPETPGVKVGGRGWLPYYTYVKVHITQWYRQILDRQTDRQTNTSKNTIAPNTH